MSSNALHISKRITTLQITGGIDVNNSFPDLHVKGGARIKKNLHVNNDIISKGTITARSALVAPLICGNLQGAITGSTLTGNLNVCHNLIINGALNVDSFNAYNIIGDVLGNVLGNFNGTLVLDTNQMANAIAAAQQPIFLDASLMDAFGRQKVSNPFTLIDNKFLTSPENETWGDLITGTATMSFMAPSVFLTVNTAGDRVVRQSRLYAPYQPGKGLTAMLTGTLETSGGMITGGSTTSRIGLFDDATDKDPVKDTEVSGNGYFFQLQGTTLSVVERTFINGAPQQDTVVPQSMWNVDKFDGTGKSQITLDTSKRQIFVIELEWLGVGTVAMGLFINRRLYFAHIFHHANILDSRAYITRPTLPLRYELSTTGPIGHMVQICSTVISDGGYQPRGSVYSVSTSSPKTVSATEAPVIAIRLKTGFKRVTLNLLKTSAASESGGDFRLAVYRYLSPISEPLTGGAWVDANAYSAAQYNETATAFTGTPIKLDDILGGANYITTGGGNNADRYAMLVTSDIVGNSDIILVTARVLGTTGSVTKFWVAIQYQELE